MHIPNIASIYHIMTRFKIHLLFIALLVGGLVACDNTDKFPPTSDPDEQTGDIEAWLTIGNESLLLGKQALDLSREQGDFTILLDSTVSYQSMDGFGAALTGSSAYLINKMKKENRKALLEDL